MDDRCPAPDLPAAPDVDGYDLSGAPGHLIRRCQQRAVDLFVAEVGESGPTPRQFAILLSVRQNPGVNQTDLVRLTGIDRSTLTEILRRMAARDWLRRARRPADRRANALWLTPAGEAVLGRVFAAVERAQARILAPLAPADRATALRVLERLAGLAGAPQKASRTDRGSVPRPG